VPIHNKVQRRFALARFEDERFELVLLLADDFLAPVRLRVVLFAADFFAVRPPLLFDAAFFLRGFSGMSAPERRASLKPIAIACLGFLTLPPWPLFNSRCLNSCIVFFILLRTMRFDLGPEPEDVFFELDFFLVLVAISIVLPSNCSL
jgi:hypothetical protein